MTLARTFLLLNLLVLALAATPDNQPPAWAYVTPAPNSKSTPESPKPRHVPNSTAIYTLAQVRDKFLSPDWHPEDHPKMPEIIAHGRKPDVPACGYCHRADGPGGPENASLAGLPYNYILEQMSNYKSGLRSTALPERLPQAMMIALAKAATDEEIQAAAHYFSSLKPRQNIRVVEAVRVPQTEVVGWVLAPKSGALTVSPSSQFSPSSRRRAASAQSTELSRSELLGHRILEVPQDLERFESRDTHATFVAYVPVGSIARGAGIVRGEKGPSCASCHGKDLRGHELAPSIAGRSPSYIFRQLYEIETRTRRGSGIKLMKAAMFHLSQDEMIDVAAYLASQKP